jgi:hypothetical protein
MTLQTVATDLPTWYWLHNAVTGEQIQLRPAAVGLNPDVGMSWRYGHQIPGASPVGYSGWKLGSKSTFVVLSTASIGTLATPVSTFGSTGALATPIWLQDGNERTVVRQNNKVCAAAPPFGNGQAIAQLEILQGGNSVLLTQANCADLAAQLATIGVT